MQRNEAVVEVINPWHIYVEELKKFHGHFSYPGGAFDMNVTLLTQYRSIPTKPGSGLATKAVL